MLLPTKALLTVCPIFPLFIGLWVWHRKKSACSKSNPVQSSRSKLKTCLRKGSLFRLKSKSTATSEVQIAARKQCLAWFWIDCSQICFNWNAVFKSSAVTCIENQSWFSIQFFLREKSAIKSAFINNYALCYWPVTYRPWGVWAAQWALSKKCANFKYFILIFNSNLCPIQWHVWIKVCSQEFWYVVSGLDVQPEQSRNNNPACKQLVQSWKMWWYMFCFFHDSDLICFCHHGSVE